MKPSLSSSNREPSRWAGRLLALAALAGLTSGCVSTFREVKPLQGGPPPIVRPSVLAIGEITITDARVPETERSMLVHAFQLGVEKWCAEHKAFEFRADGSSTNLPPGTIILRGTITEVEKGSSAARFWVGMGAGQERVVGEFVISALDGARLMGFTARKSYLGGSGAGGMDMLSLQDLMVQLGQLVAENTDKWLRGQKLS